MSAASIYIVCSPHAKTGASTVTRLLCDYLTCEGRAFALYDTDPQSHALDGWFPGACTNADITTTRGQIALFERLVSPGEAPRVVDVSSQFYSRFFTQVRDINLFDEAAKSGLKPYVLFVSDGSRGSVAAAQAIRSEFRTPVLIPVINEGPVRTGGAILEHLYAFQAPHSFQIPALDPSARDVIENTRFSLSTFLIEGTPDAIQRLVQAELRSWLKSVYTQFHAYEVRKAFEETRYLMSVSAFRR